MRTDMRFCPAATLLRQGFTVEQFRQTCDATRALFHEAGLPKGETQESLACLILMEEAEDDVPSREQVERVAAIFAEMRSHSRLLTGRDDYPAAALLSAQPGTPEELIGRANRIYEALRDLKFGRGNQLQLASHMLTTAPEPDEVLVERFRRLYEVFRDRGLYAYRGARDVDALEAFAREGYAVDRGASRRPVPPEPTRFRRLFSALTRRLAVEMIRAYDLTAAAMKTASGDYRRVARAFRREGVGGALSAVRRAFADAPKTYGCAALLVSVLGICLALVAALASAPIKRHPGSTKRKSE